MTDHVNLDPDAPRLSDSRPAHHNVKCLPKWYADIRFKRKRFEVRLNDRDYHEGDVLELNEFYPCESCHPSKNGCGACNYTTGKYSGVFHTEIIGRVWKDVPGLMPDHVILDLR